MREISLVSQKSIVIKRPKITPKTSEKKAEIRLISALTKSPSKSLEKTPSANKILIPIASKP